MGLGLSVDTGERKALVKYDARAGRMHRVDRVDGANVPTEITNGFAAIFDLENIEVGWARFNAGGAPEWAMVKLGQPKPAKPAPDFKQAFRMNIKLGRNSGGDVREFSSAAGCVIAALDKLHDQYAAAPERSHGKLPVVSISNTTMVVSGSGAQKSTNYAPNFVISQWQPRPADLGAGASAVPHSPAVAGFTVPPPQPLQVLQPQGNGNGHADMSDDIPF